MNTQEPIPVWDAEIAVGKPPEDIDLLSYLPPFMAAYRELSAGLRAEEPEFRLLWQGAHRVLINQFVLTADDFGLKRYETLLHLLPAPSDSIETRRARILAALMRHPPYTITWLRAWLDGLCGEGAHRETVEDYTLSLWFDGSALTRVHLTPQEIIYLLYPILPVNLTWGIHIEMPPAVKNLRVGGRFGTHGQLGMAEKADVFDSHHLVHMGGALGARAVLQGREDWTAPRVSGTVRAGGRFASVVQLANGTEDTEGPRVHRRGCARTVMTAKGEG